MADYGDLVLVDGWLLHEVIHDPRSTPGPGSDRRPTVGPALVIEQGMNAVFEAIVLVGIDGGVVERGHRIAARDALFDRPERRLVFAGWVDVRCVAIADEQKGRRGLRPFVRDEQ